MEHKYKLVDNTRISNNYMDQYGQREVPNIRMCATPIEDGPPVEFFFDTVKEYEETYDSNTGFTTRIVLALFSPYLYENIAKKYSYYTIETSNYWRKAKDGKDYCFEGLKRTYNHLTIEHIVNSENDYSDWIITLDNI